MMGDEIRSFDAAHCDIPGLSGVMPSWLLLRELRDDGVIALLKNHEQWVTMRQTESGPIEYYFLTGISRYTHQSNLRLDGTFRT